MKMIIIVSFVAILLPVATRAQNSKFKPHYVNHTEFGGLFGRVKFNFGNSESQVDSKLSATIQTFSGFQLTRRLATGLTVGMDWYKTALVNPLAAGIRYDLTAKGPARLFATLDAGYGATWLHQDSDGYNTKGGMMLNPGIGLKYGKPGSSAFTISLSYKRQEVKVNKPLFSGQTYRQEERVYNRMALRLGMTF